MDKAVDSNTDSFDPFTFSTVSIHQAQKKNCHEVERMTGKIIVEQISTEQGEPRHVIMLKCAENCRFLHVCARLSLSQANGRK